jgi:hypothetical protein
MGRLSACLLAAMSLAAASCSEDEPYRKPTVPVRGIVTIDGKVPDTAVQVQFHSLQGMDAEHPTMSQTETKPDGSFEVSTYESGDGVPEGDYALTFSWQKFDLFSRSYTGPDKLSGRYKDPKKSEFKVTVKDADEPIDLGEIKLTTK